jgi:hypothetical protein
VGSTPTSAFIEIVYLKSGITIKKKIPFKKDALKLKAKELGLKPLWLDKTNPELRKIYEKFMNKKIENYILE